MISLLDLHFQFRIRCPLCRIEVVLPPLHQRLDLDINSVILLLNALVLLASLVPDVR